MSYRATGAILFDSGPPPDASGAGFDPFNALFDFIDKSKLDIEIALTDPKVQEFMREAGIKSQEVRLADKKRKEKSSLLKWGAAAAVIGFLIIRKKK